MSRSSDRSNWRLFSVKNIALMVFMTTVNPAEGVASKSQPEVSGQTGAVSQYQVYIRDHRFGESPPKAVEVDSDATISDLRRAIVELPILGSFQIMHGSVLMKDFQTLADAGIGNEEMLDLSYPSNTIQSMCTLINMLSE